MPSLDAENIKYQKEDINIALKKSANQTKTGAPTVNCTCTLDWFANNGFYPVSSGLEVDPLICGEEAFAALHDAISKATKSVDIIIWGFDPMMRFKPNEESIGDLLRRKGKEGVKCRVLVWQSFLSGFLENTVVGNGLFGSGGTSLGSGITSGSPMSNAGQNTQQYRATQRELEQLMAQRDKAKQDLWLAQELVETNIEKSMTDEQKGLIAEAKKRIAEVEKKIAEVEKKNPHEYNSVPSRDSGAPVSEPNDQIKARNWFRDIKGLGGKGMPNVEFQTRDFSSADRDRVSAMLKGLDMDGNGWRLRTIIRLGLSHHQKLVLIDYQDPAKAVGFVMGHNMHRNYWDTRAHHYYDNDGQRTLGFGPWQDISSRVKGEILYDINQNFVKAWDKEVKGSRLEDERKDIERTAFISHSKGNKQGQFCRTQPQETKTCVYTNTPTYDRSILEIYKKAIGNAHSYLYMENQYFRYKDIGTAIRQRALEIQNSGRSHGASEQTDPLYLFVLTNTPNSNNMSETTYAALKELGQQQLMPEAQRQSHHERGLLHYLNPINWFNSTTYDSDMSQTDKDHIEQVKTTEDIEKMSEAGQGYDIEGVDGKKPFELEEIDGLKVLIGTLACDNTHSISAYEQAQYACYRSIYIHSKVLVVDDIFTLIASANINIRSLWADSESGIAVPDAALGYKMRKELWEMHATESMDNPDSNSSVAIKCDATANYEHWDAMMNLNWKFKADRKPLKCHIVRFWDTTTGYAYAVD